MSNPLIQSLNSAVRKYSRLRKKVKKSISKGDFWKYTRTKRNYLVHKIENLRRRIAELNLQIKLAGAGMAAGLLMAGANAEAQTTTIGPFRENGLKNPLPRPAFERFQNPAVTFWDFDNDGDLDASMGTGSDYSRSIHHYQNVGTKTAPYFTPHYQDGMYIQYTGNYTNPGRPVYADIDDDGDLDLVIGLGYSSNDSSEDDQPDFYRNLSEAPGSNNFQKAEYFENPFYNMYSYGDNWPAFTDIDKDGDLDFILSGRYYEVETGQYAYIRVFRNDKVGKAPGVDPTYTQLVGPDNNPLWTPEDPVQMVWAITFADVDNDGDEDLFAVKGNGDKFYRRNDNGVFTQQENIAYVYKPNGQSTGNPLQISNLELATLDSYQSYAFGDLDGDGDKDLVLSTNNIGTFNPQHIFVENTGNGVMVARRGPTEKVSGISIGDEGRSSLVDYDKDGDLDIFISGAVETVGIEGQLFSVIGNKLFKNNNGSFVDQTILSNPFAGFAAPGVGNQMIVDVDGDGDYDHLSFEENSYNQTAVNYRRNDNGTYILTSKTDNPFEFLTVLGYSSIELDLADLDGDKKPDLVAVLPGSGIVFYKNTGTVTKPAFTQEGTWRNGIISNSSNYDVKVFDVDNDGDFDLSLGKYGSIWYFENIGTINAPSWKENYSTSGSPNPTSYEKNPFANFSGSGQSIPNLADLDGDGDNDLLAISDPSTGRDSYFSFYENQNPAPVVTQTVTNIALVPKVALTLDAGLAFTDSDNDKIVKVTAKIAPFEPGQEKLKLNGTFPGIVANWVDTTGVLTLSGNAAASVYQNAIRNIQYIFTAGDASVGRKGNKSLTKNRGKIVNKTVTMSVIDADLTIGTPNTKVFNISGDDGTTGVSAPVIDTDPKKAAAKGNVALDISQIASDADNDLDLSTLVVTSQQGATVIIANGIVTVDYNSLPDFLGNDVITVTICDSGGRCTTSSFDVEVGAQPYVFTGMSPNGDGINDWFTIEYLPKGTKVSIYNRWGDAVFETDDYDVKDPAKRFEGKTRNGTDVTAGSYFYKIRVPDVTHKDGYYIKTGYILLNR